MSGIDDGYGENTADVFAELAIELHQSDGVEETVEAVLQFALQAVNCTQAGLALAQRGGRIEIAAVTGPVVETVYQLQIDTGEGPLIDTLRGGHTMLIRDAGTETRWPEWGTKITELGLRTVLHIALQVNDRIGGVLSLYSREPDAFDDDDDAVAHILARHAAIAVATARHEETMNLAVDARKLVGQAMGILMERYEVDGDRAFAILRRYSQDTNTKLRDVALRLVDTRKLSSPDPVGPDHKSPPASR
ncbi:GAF and ANTAR domain-containing protein [Kribbella qitaiheensis]|uniref:GAF and ANTAR domain-containing protein n=1 Tax=Kribbella qitaiheensis TaxID=1544730 RepID=A0A7G6WU84_9ACTN|nr:GAF and ANTAR domain-containing protein [Kribbella qitaiheensis]QNE17549.1 GAF and ANTAR domain-containing protein [Kribbella qitaiheensis]